MASPHIHPSDDIQRTAHRTCLTPGVSNGPDGAEHEQVRELAGRGPDHKRLGMIVVLGTVLIVLAIIIRVTWPMLSAQ